MLLALWFDFWDEADWTLTAEFNSNYVIQTRRRRRSR